jgi:predicted nicotinamide N-methyase
MPVTLPRTGISYRVLQPASFDRLLTAVADDPEQNLPYWAAIWPSGIALGDAILQQPTRVHGQPVLELGSGIGVTATAALAAGAKLLVTDYSPETLLLCRANTLRNGGLEPRTLQLNWRKPNAMLFADAPYPVVLAADVLYEKRDIEPLLALLDRIIAPGGALWLAEPRRTPAQLFVEAAQAAGWHDELAQHTGPWPDAGDKQIVVNLHWMRRQHERDLDK